MKCRLWIHYICNNSALHNLVHSLILQQPKTTNMNTLLLSILTFFPDSSATVKKVDSLNVYVFASPTTQYEVLYQSKTVICVLCASDDLVKAAVSNVKKHCPNCNGIIISDNLLKFQGIHIK